ncbi:MAG: endonuclease/exonuclease/phosphatase family protein, partial [Alphaproteobacteria bacterium]
RVDYVLPDAGLVVTGSGVVWPAPDDPFAETVARASRHRLVWVDVEIE